MADSTASPEPITTAQATTNPQQPKPTVTPHVTTDAPQPMPTATPQIRTDPPQPAPTPTSQVTTNPAQPAPTPQVAPTPPGTPAPVDHPATEDSADPAAAREVDVPARMPTSAAVVPEPPLETAKAEAHPTPDTRTEPWAKLIADPGHAPELLALAAVQSIGPRAAEWAQHLRERYPHADNHGLARLAERQFLRFGGVGSAFAAVAGSYVPIALLASNAVTYAELILHVAAAYGLDPADRRRAVELLVLTQVHATPEDAEEALAAAEQPPYEDDARLTDAVWRLGRMATAQAGAWALVRAVNRFFPGVTVLASVITSRSGVRVVAGRAANFYSQLSQDSGSSV